MTEALWGVPKMRGTVFGGPQNKDPTILGYYIGVPYFRKLSYDSMYEITRPYWAARNPAENLNVSS